MNDHAEGAPEASHGGGVKDLLGHTPHCVSMCPGHVRWRGPLPPPRPLG